MAEVYLYRLTNGDEVIASETSNTERWTSIEDAVALVYHQTDKGVSVGFAPFLPQSDGDIKLMNHDIGAITRPNEQVLSEYNRIFSKIVAPSQKIIV